MSQNKPKSTSHEDNKSQQQEMRLLQEQVREANSRIVRLQRKLAIAKNRELALMQANRMLIDVTKSYADREAVVLAGWKTMHETFQATVELD